jgi:hypothetical protein
VLPRHEFLAPLIGQPWAWQSRNCWDFACHVQRELFGRLLPHVAVPDDPKWKWMVRTVAKHPERANWCQLQDGPMGLVTAADGALCLMGRFSGPGHIGVWLQPEGKVIHCDRSHGVCLETVLALRQKGWTSIMFFEPKSS